MQRWTRDLMEGLFHFTKVTTSGWLPREMNEYTKESTIFLVSKNNSSHCIDRVIGMDEARTLGGRRFRLWERRHNNVVAFRADQIDILTDRDCQIRAQRNQTFFKAANARL